MASNKTVFFIIGILLIILGIFMLAPYAIQLIYNEKSSSFFSSAIITIVIGILTVLTSLTKDKQLNLKQAFLFSFWRGLVLLFWKCPFMLSSLNLSFSEFFLRVCQV